MGDITKVNDIVFHGRKNIPWEEVAKYMRKYQGDAYTVVEYKDIIKVSYTSIDEYISSKYTRQLKGTLAKTKANIVQILPDLIKNASNRRWVENNDEKHKNNASNGWYRYDVFFAMPLKAEYENDIHWNEYKATMIVRANDTGLYFYDIINIEKRSE